MWSEYSQLDEKDETCQRSALSWAAGNGHDGVVKRLIRGLSIGPRSLEIVLRQGAKIKDFDSDNRTALTYAIWNRHLSVVRCLVKAGAWVDVPDVLGATPTSYAVTSGNVEIEDLALRGDVPSSTEHSEGEKLLLSAAKYGHIHVVRVLMEARKTNANPKDDWGWTPLMWAINYRHSAVIKLLLEHNLDDNIRDKTGMTPIHFATRYGQFEIAKLILQTGRADVSIPDLAGLTTLDLALSLTRDDTAQLILETVNDKNVSRVKYQESGISRFVKYNSCSTLKYTLQHNGEQFSVRDCTVAIFETESDWADKIKVLLNFKKIDTSLPNANGDTVLHQAVQMQAYEILNRLLIVAKDLLNDRNKRGLTPLAPSSLTQNLNMLNILVHNDQVDVNIADKNGDSPLHLAIHANSEPVTALILLTKRISVEMKNKEGFTPLSLACLTGNTTIYHRLLHPFHADINSQDIHGRTPLYNCIWFDEIKGPRARTALLLTTLYGNSETVKLLVSSEKINVNLHDDEGLTPLSHAAQQGNEEIIQMLLSKPDLDVDAKDDAGMTALAHAAKKGHLGAVELLLNEGKANSRIKDNRGKTPSALASAERHVWVVQSIYVVKAKN
ncbi:hypothetical protein ACKAV7_010667 [Fusarium commune]